jgi:hypothetical protein
MKAQHKSLVEKSGVQSYKQALAFHLTCDERYAKNAMAILDDWARGNQSFGGQNAPLEAAWAVASMARTAELLKYTYEGWDPAVEQRFLTWVKDRLEPQMNRQVKWEFSHWHNNWHTSINEAKLQLAILRGDRQGYENMLAYYDRIIEGRVGYNKKLDIPDMNDRYILPSGQTQETCRDIAHAQFAQGSLLQVPEIAWHQGDDLYSRHQTLLIKTMEYHAPLVRKGKEIEGKVYPSNTLNKDLNDKRYGTDCVMKWVGFQPTWEIGYHHFHDRMGQQLPESRKTLEQFRPEKYIFHWGSGTLTHYQP